jgi:recombination protein RecT
MSEGNEKPKKPVPASTVILVLDAGEPFQVYLVRRSVRSSFMPGNYVFPGGKVDSGDQ